MYMNAEGNIPQFNLLLIGDSYAGKSQLLSRFTDDEFTDSYCSTIGVETKSKNVWCSDREQEVKLKIQDRSGAEKYRTLTSDFVKSTGIFIIVVAANQTFAEKKAQINRWCDDINYFTSHTSKVFIIAETKTDLAPLKKDEFGRPCYHVLTDTERAEVLNEGDLYFNCSSKTKDNFLAFETTLFIAFDKLNPKQAINSASGHIGTPMTDEPRQEESKRQNSDGWKTVTINTNYPTWLSWFPLFSGPVTINTSERENKSDIINKILDLGGDSDGWNRQILEKIKQKLIVGTINEQLRDKNTPFSIPYELGTNGGKTYCYRERQDGPDLTIKVPDNVWMMLEKIDHKKPPQHRSTNVLLEIYNAIACAVNEESDSRTPSTSNFYRHTLPEFIEALVKDSWDTQKGLQTNNMQHGQLMK